MVPKKTNSEFRWTRDELELSIQSCLQYKSQQEFQGVSCKGVRNNHQLNF